jgi:DNA recombination protein RmuC
LFAAVAVAGVLVGALGGAALARAFARAGRERMRVELEQIARASQQRMRDEMAAISADVLRQTGDSLAQRLADQRRAEEERAAGEMARRAEEIKGLVAPVNEKLGRVESEIGRLERERKQAQGELASMVRQLHEGVGGLRQETGNLVSALKRPSTRGSWGEIQLRNVIELAGMVEHCDFLEQSTIRSDDGALRPDVLVKLPGGKVIVVDSKVPLDAYLAHLEAQSDAERDAAIARHARQTRDHIVKLASKGYHNQFDTTPDLVVMFVPSEGIFHAALAQDPGLIEYGVHQQVLLATPTTLIGLLRAVHYGWRQELIAESAREIAESARELHRRLARFVEPLAKVGRQLGSAVGAYNEAVGSFDGRVVPQLRRIEEAGAKSERELTAPTPVEASPRQLLSGRPALEEEPNGEPLLQRISRASATGTVAGSSSTAKNSRSNAIASAATSKAPLN